MPNDPNATLPSPSAPVWRNWSGNLVHEPASDRVRYYFTPTNLAELKSALAEAAKAPGATVRVSGQRHSQTPLVVDEDRGPAPQTRAFLVDMSCYGDLGPGQDQRIVLGPGSKQVTVNAGVREDELDAFLTKNNLMLTTVTAGGFFSLGGMTAVDVHGGTMDAPIFAETVSAFTLVLADGSVMTIDAQSPAVGGWSPLQFARVSLGALGVVTSVTIDVEDRPWATTLRGGTEQFGLADKAAFVETFKTLLKDHTRLETFFTPYATGSVGFPLHAKNFLALWWDVVSDPPTKTPNAPNSPDNACVLAARRPPEFGAPYLGQIATYGADLAEQAQYVKSPGNTPSGFIEDRPHQPLDHRRNHLRGDPPGSWYGQSVAFGPVAHRRGASHFHVLLHPAARPRRCRACKSVGRPGCGFADGLARRRLPHGGADGVPLRQGRRHGHVGDVHRKT